MSYGDERMPSPYESNLTSTTVIDAQKAQAEPISQLVTSLAIAAFGCALAWGIIDGAMYVLLSLLERGETNRLLKTLKAVPTEQAAIDAIVALVAGNFPPARRSAAYGMIAAAGAIAVAAGHCAKFTNTQLSAALQTVGVPADLAAEVVEENSSARLVALRDSMAVVALFALVALFLSGRIPTVPVGSAEGSPVPPGRGSLDT
jgi:hypothetical protein